ARRQVIIQRTSLVTPIDGIRSRFVVRGEPARLDEPTADPVREVLDALASEQGPACGVCLHRALDRRDELPEPSWRIDLDVGGDLAGLSQELGGRTTSGEGKLAALAEAEAAHVPVTSLLRNLLCEVKRPVRRIEILRPALEHSEV